MQPLFIYLYNHNLGHVSVNGIFIMNLGQADQLMKKTVMIVFFVPWLLQQNNKEFSKTLKIFFIKMLNFMQQLQVTNILMYL